MSNRIDCSVQSHGACLVLEEHEEPALVPDEPPRQEESAEASRFHCVNDCISSRGLPQLVGASVAALICADPLTTIGCPIAIGGIAGALVGWCDAECGDRAVDGKQ